MKEVRVRFAPSPTGALHIGGVRTALYNYLFAKKNKGKFILRVEDTDRTRFVRGAEDYICEALDWLGLTPDEGPKKEGPFSPYRQSERKEYYTRFARELIENGQAYYAFDTAAELDKARRATPNFKYDALTRQTMANSIALPQAEVSRRIEAGTPHVIRLKVPEHEEVKVRDAIRGEVVFQTGELDDKVILKSDGLPTYHLANVVDDHLMKISHVIRGEEWLPSTAHHILLYKALGWEDEMPLFAHLPLILKPDGKGKLSKRDGARLGIPVFPLSWNGDSPDTSFVGFREAGFLPDAVTNFLAFLGWNPGTEQEIFSLKELIAAFSLDNISKGGSRFDFDKAQWYNQQYILNKDIETLLPLVKNELQKHTTLPDDLFLKNFIGLMQERAVVLPDFWEKGSYFFESVESYEPKMILKKWKPDNRYRFEKYTTMITEVIPFEPKEIENVTKDFMASCGLKGGAVMPIIRLAVSGTMQGPGVYDIMALLGKEKVVNRLERAYDAFDKMVKQNNAAT